MQPHAAAAAFTAGFGTRSLHVRRLGLWPGAKEGIVVSTLAELEFFGEAGFDDILYGGNAAGGLRRRAPST